VDYTQKLLESYAAARYQELFGNVEANPIKQGLEQTSREEKRTLGLVIVAGMFTSFILVILVLRLSSLS
jgi:hypothetical protein